MLIASRTDGRDTPKSSASSRSDGSLSPGLTAPVRIEVRICSAIWEDTFFGLMGLKISASCQEGRQAHHAPAALVTLGVT
jgi:hypothetical protein